MAVLWFLGTANIRVGLMRRVKTDKGWGHYPAVYAAIQQTATLERGLLCEQNPYDLEPLAAHDQPEQMGESVSRRH